MEEVVHAVSRSRLIYILNTNDVRNDDETTKGKYAGHGNPRTQWQVQHESHANWHNENGKVNNDVDDTGCEKHGGAIGTFAGLSREPEFVDRRAGEDSYELRCNEPAKCDEYYCERDVLVGIRDEEHTAVEVENRHLQSRNSRDVKNDGCENALSGVIQQLAECIIRKSLMHTLR